MQAKYLSRPSFGKHTDLMKGIQTAKESTFGIPFYYLCVKRCLQLNILCVCSANINFIQPQPGIEERKNR
ncbi:hypothetical protein I7I50_02159 [Histoplasma capsulatum G186AR]|uniref:Uncharacterized protein n=1 Tax=Ajellomyces capsulatus TaxID=5037 RepID=A0A8H7YFB2_AJECA|nr:hypothetical protein I7I52_12373 [Histoplasma capsulatum]QSS71357.1 hypothetical protein I7I50_02159 [Histoplasma capsulatum G186AR]